MADDEDRQLFEEALASISERDVFKGKYGSPDDDASNEEANDPVDNLSREEIQRLREQREMENAFAGVERINDQVKYHVPAPRDELGAGDADDLRAEFEAALRAPTATTPVEPADAPTRSLADSAPDDVHTLNLRGFDPDDALVKLGLFVDLASKDQQKLIRIRVGTNPPLLQAVQDWFRGPGIAYLEDLEIAQQHGDAAVFARIRRTKHP